MTHDFDISRSQGPWAPDGLHPAGPGTIGPRLAILLAAGVVPLLIFALLA